MSILSAIGNTPVVEVKNMVKNPRVKVLAKLEGNNPGGSVKDRIAYYMIEKAEKSGALTRDKVILEPTSGNTGIGLAMIAAAKDYRVKLVMPACVSVERQNTLKAFGAELEITPGERATDGAIERARVLYKDNPDLYFMPNQFDNQHNALAHYETTGKEILEQTNGELAMFVAGMGTTGTLMGVSRRLKEANPKVKVVGVEPQLNHTIQGLKNLSEAIVPKIFEASRLDDKIVVSDDDAYNTARTLATKKGMFVGMSSGAAMFGAMQMAEKIKSGVIVVIFPDRGDRYLSTTLFRSICAKCPP